MILTSPTASVIVLVNMFYRRKSTAGEIATVVAVGTLIIMGVASLVGSLFLKKQDTKLTTKSKAAENCINVIGVESSPSEVTLGSEFNCRVRVDSAFSQSRTIACGVSVNNGYPQNFCPSDRTYKGWIGGAHVFGCTIPSSAVPQNASVELVGFDFSSLCGPTSGKRFTLNITGHQQPIAVPTQPPPAGCQAGKVNKQGICDLACCSNNSECPKSEETCINSNGNCNSGWSCGVPPAQVPPIPPPSISASSPQVPVPTAPSSALCINMITTDVCLRACRSPSTCFGQYCCASGQVTPAPTTPTSSSTGTAGGVEKGKKAPGKPKEPAGPGSGGSSQCSSFIEKGKAHTLVVGLTGVPVPEKPLNKGTSICAGDTLFTCPSSAQRTQGEYESCNHSGKECKEVDGVAQCVESAPPLLGSTACIDKTTNQTISCRPSIEQINTTVEVCSACNGWSAHRKQAISCGSGNPSQCQYQYFINNNWTNPSENRQTSRTCELDDNQILKLQVGINGLNNLRRISNSVIIEELAVCIRGLGRDDICVSYDKIKSIDYTKDTFTTDIEIPIKKGTKIDRIIVAIYDSTGRRYVDGETTIWNYLDIFPFNFCHSDLASFGAYSSHQIPGMAKSHKRTISIP